QGETYSSDIWYGNRRIMVTDARLNCLSVGVLNNETANFTIDQNMVATAEPAEIIPAANTLGSCDLMQKHLTGPFEADFAFTNTSDTAVRVYRVDNETGELSESFGFKTLNKGDTYDSATSWKWFGNRRAAVTTETGQCLAVAVMSEENSVNRYEISNEIVGGTSPLDSDGDGVIDAQDAFPFDPTETKDSDGDGVGDNGDAFPFDASESKDSDGDGYGDNSDAFPNDASEWLDSDGDGQGDNSDPYPNDPDNGGGTVSNCGQATISSGRLTLGDTECVTGGRGSFYVWIENDNTGLVIATAGGEGDVGIYFNADTWATQSNAQAQSGGSGTTKTLAVIANRGWRYISLDTSGQYQGVSLTVTEGQADGGNNGGGTEPPVDSAISNACASQSLFTYGAVESGKAICTGQGHNSYYIYFTGNESEVTIQTAHGAGEVKLYSDVNWANANQYQFKSTNAGTTVQSITVNNPSVGWYYITADTTGSNVALQVDVK
ncbi:MAG: collagenase, partial [Pseudoalteromonas tunicata]|nr:collagenase [Pseudoalteromonas tunicata]